MRGRLAWCVLMRRHLPRYITVGSSRRLFNSLLGEIVNKSEAASQQKVGSVTWDGQVAKEGYDATRYRKIRRWGV